VPETVAAKGQQEAVEHHLMVDAPGVGIAFLALEVAALPLPAVEVAHPPRRARRI
jgi:Holliday junction resolvasome RuvABC ATP-dependent DNA helicase subunit